VMNFNPYPNPVQGILQVDLNSAAELLVTDLRGRQMNVYHGHEGNNQLDLHLPSGIYFLQALFPTGLRVSRRIVIP
ncbi:MAG: T9SS type A sorting domain-containing protein, partial [Bacteroidota bacterium]